MYCITHAVTGMASNYVTTEKFKVVKIMILYTGTNEQNDTFKNVTTSFQSSHLTEPLTHFGCAQA